MALPKLVPCRFVFSLVLDFFEPHHADFPTPHRPGRFLLSVNSIVSIVLLICAEEGCSFYS